MTEAPKVNLGVFFIIIVRFISVLRSNYITNFKTHDHHEHYLVL